MISDIHGNSLALRAVFSPLLAEVDQILFLGDLCGYYPFVDECIDLCRENRIVGIRGNHDQVLLDCWETGKEPSNEYQARFGSGLVRAMQNLSLPSLTFLRSLPPSRTLTLNGALLTLYHGAPWDPLEGRVYPDFVAWGRFNCVAADYILLGHTHYQLAKRYEDRLIINPGSVGQPRDRSGGACFAILDLASGLVQHHRVPFDSRPIIEDARKHDPDLPYLADVLTRQ